MMFVFREIERRHEWEIMTRERLSVWRETGNKQKTTENHRENGRAKKGAGKGRRGKEMATS